MHNARSVDCKKTPEIIPAAAQDTEKRDRQSVNSTICVFMHPSANYGISVVSRFTARILAILPVRTDSYILCECFCLIYSPSFVCTILITNCQLSWNGTRTQLSKWWESPSFLSSVYGVFLGSRDFPGVQLNLHQNLKTLPQRNRGKFKQL